MGPWTHKSGIRYQVSGAARNCNEIPGALPPSATARTQIHSPRPTVHSPRSTVHGPRSTVHGPRSTSTSTVHGPRSSHRRISCVESFSSAETQSPESHSGHLDRDYVDDERKGHFFVELHCDFVKSDAFDGFAELHGASF